MENGKTWILVADASKARLFSTHKARLFSEKKPNNLELIQEFTHEDSRKKGIDLKSDRMGENAHGTFAEGTPPKKIEAERFALELSHALDSKLKENSLHDLILVAPPAFMGLLNKHLSHGLQKVVSQTIEKDYTQDSVNHLVDNLLQHF